MDLLGAVFILMVVCLAVSSIILGVVISALILWRRRNRTKPAESTETVNRENMSSTEVAEPGDDDSQLAISEAIKRELTPVITSLDYNTRLTFIMLSITLMLAAGAGLVEDILWRFLLYGGGIAVLVGGYFKARRR